MKRFFVVSILFAITLANVSCKKSVQPEPVAGKVFFVEPKDGAEVAQTFLVKFGVSGMELKPAGEDMMNKHAGHHHLLIDNQEGFNPEGQVVLADATNIHFGKAQTETTLTLSPGKHKLSLQFADGAHISYGKALSASINITVK